MPKVKFTKPEKHEVDFLPVCIEWVDPCGGSGWMEVRPARNMRPHACQTIGFILYQDEERTVMAASRSWSTSGDVEVGDRVVVPTSLIKKIGPISFGSNKKKP